MNSPEKTAQARQIRVFISSTFRDMQGERDCLVKFIFPQLRKLCESRGVIWGEVDLRWGVTDEQAAEGKVLPICLEEIKRCRPYFIGLLGERYGWIPGAIPSDLLEREPWLSEHLHGKTSVTELEILHGVLRNPQMAGHAYFYFRDPKYVEPLDKEIFSANKAKDAEKVRNLKGKIRQSGFPVRENYPDPKGLGELVLTDLTKVINDTWPEGSQPDPLDRDAMDHEAYAQSRERVYIGRQEYFDRLDTHAAANDTQPIVVLGESGSGKSALLANWVKCYRQTHPAVLVLQHYIGATPYSSDWAAMLRRIMGEFKRRLGLQQDIPDQPDALRSAFPNWLYMAAAKGRVVLVLDALNQLEDRDGAPDLVWLPPVMPGNVRLIGSTLPGRALDEIQKRNWPTLKVELLSADERRKLITGYLAQHAKSLNTARVERIAAAPPSANPLYLRVLLDELRLVRTHEELEGRIGDYLKAESAYALYEKVIARWEQDYEGDSDLVGHTLSLLWAARRGLTETELLRALGKGCEPLPRAKWSPLFLAMSDALISRGGLLTFAHDFLRIAVENAYLPTEQKQKQAHLRLAEYFEHEPANLRRTSELPWQLLAAGEVQRLRTTLLDIEKFFALAKIERGELLGYWIRIGEERQMAQLYMDSFQVWVQHLLGSELRLIVINTAEDLGLFLRWSAHYTDAAVLLGWASNMAVKCFGTDSLHSAITTANFAQVLSDQNRISEAKDGFFRALELLEAHYGENSIKLVPLLNNLAEVFRKTSELHKAQELYRRAIAIIEQSDLRMSPQMATLQSNLALSLKASGQFTEAKTYFNKALSIDEAACGKISMDMARDLNNLGELMRDLNDCKTAEELLRRSILMKHQLVGTKHPDYANGLNNLAEVLRDVGKTKEAEPLYRQAVHIWELIDPHDPQVAIGLNNLASLVTDCGRIKEAVSMRERVIRIFGNYSKKTGLQHPHFKTALEYYTGLLQMEGFTDDDIQLKISTLISRS